MTKIILVLWVSLVGVEKPLIYQEEMPTAQSCGAAVADLIARPPLDLAGQQVKQYQASCVLVKQDGKS